jgi:hypothetical protein
MNGGVERDRRITDELTRFLIRDNPDEHVADGRVADAYAAAPQEPRPKVGRRTDLLLACLIVVIAFGLLHFVTPWGETDTISRLIYAIVSGDWSAAVLSAAVILICGCLIVPLPYVVLRSIRGRSR